MRFVYTPSPTNPYLKTDLPSLSKAGSSFVKIRDNVFVDAFALLKAPVKLQTKSVFQKHHIIIP